MTITIKINDPFLMNRAHNYFYTKMSRSCYAKMKLN